MKKYVLPCALGLLSCAAGIASARPGDTVASLVSRFDLATGEGLPATLDTGDTDTGRRVRRSPSADMPAGDMVVERRLNVQVDFPGGETGRMFAGRFRGEEAVFTRTGDHLDVTVVREQGVDVTGFTQDDPAVEHEERRDTPEVPRVPGTENEPAAGRQKRTTYPEEVPVSVPPGHREDPAAYDLRFFIFLHDGIDDGSTRHIHAQFVAWWVAETTSSVLPTHPLRVSYYARVPWMTDIAVGHASTLDTFARAMWLWGHLFNGHYARTFKHKFLLLTKDRPAPGVGGQSYEGGSVAMASIDGRTRIVAHELGHMLGAVHEDAEVLRKNWWWCESNMYPTGSLLRSDCQAYTPANDRRIRSYMRHGPDAVVPRLFSDP